MLISHASKRRRVRQLELARNIYRTLVSLSHRSVEPATKLDQADAFSVTLHVIKVM